MFKSIIYLTVAFVSLALANEPISVTISGPSKICTNDIVIYTANTAGSVATSYTWIVDGVNLPPSNNNTYTLIAPSSAANISIQCVVLGSGNNPQSDMDTFNVAVVVPQIVVSRQSFKISDFQGNVTMPDCELIDDQGAAYIHRNGLLLDSERFPLSITITPADIEVQQFELTTSDTEALHLYKRVSNQQTKLQLPKSKVDETYISDFNYLKNLNVDGRICGTDYTITLEINNSQKLSINYNVYGMGTSVFSFPLDDTIKNKFKNAFPRLVDNEWGYISGSDNSSYNSIAYAVGDQPWGGHYFWVEPSFSSNYGLTDYYPFRNKTGTTDLETSMDFFGNKNNTLDISDVDDFFTSALWGNHRIVNSIETSTIIYYEGFYAAKKSSHSEGFYPLWHIFQSKYEEEETILTRAEQLINTTYISILKFYK